MSVLYGILGRLGLTNVRSFVNFFVRLVSVGETYNSRGAYEVISTAEACV
jgi:hypothetical protein